MVWKGSLGRESEMRDEAKIDLARRHMIAVSAGLKHVLGPHAAADVLAGAALTLLVDARGKAEAIQYLHQLGDELENDETIIETEKGAMQ